jgi:hypothetical protein
MTIDTGTGEENSVAQRLRLERMCRPVSRNQSLAIVVQALGRIHLEVVFASGVVVRVPHDFNARASQRLMSVLGGR